MPMGRVSMGMGMVAARLPVPANSVLPVISGTLTVGQTLSVTDGTWSPTPVSYTYQWKRDGASISAALAATYVLVIADQGAAITCAVTAINASGSATATSAATAAIGAWNPLDIFSGGYGAWYDPSDLTTLWKDTAGTQQVTADGDAVARIDDKSGNGLHLVQATGANCPLYKTDGTLRWLQFDGTNDRLQKASVDLSAYFKATVFTSWRRSVDDADRIIFAHGGTGTVSGFLVRSPSGANTNFSSSQRGATTAVSAARSTTAAPVSIYGTGLFDIQAPSVQGRTGGVAGTAQTGATGGGNFSTQTLSMGCSSISASSFFSGNVYQIIAPLKTASATELLNAENHCRLKAGL